jgi:hypothetical protein
VGLAAAREASASRDTEAMEASASPRKAERRDGFEVGRQLIFDVAWRATASGSSSRAMPAPSSTTRMRLTPPPREVDVDLRRAGVDGVLEELLQRRGGTLDHLAAAIWLIRRSGACGSQRSGMSAAKDGIASGRAAS